MQWLPVILILPYLFLILKVVRNLQSIQPYVVSNEPSVFVSVVVACRNEQAALPYLLEDISAQNYSKELFELIISDDNSSDATRGISLEFTGIQNIQVVENTGKGKKQAINSGISTARGELIITTDADCRIGNNWLKTIVSFYEKEKADMIICPVQIKQSTGFFGKFQELEFLSLQGITAGTAIAGNGTMCNGANLAFTREAYLKNRDNIHFEKVSGDDIFLLHSLKKQTESKVLWLESFQAIATTAPSSSFRSLINQRRRWLSKSGAYTDKATIYLGIVTFVTILLELTVMGAAIFNNKLILVFVTIFLLKSLIDYLILRNTVKRYKRKKLMNWFLPVQIVYPFYVILVAVYAALVPLKQSANSPSPKGI